MKKGRVLWLLVKGLATGFFGVFGCASVALVTLCAIYSVQQGLYSIIVRAATVHENPSVLAYAYDYSMGATMLFLVAIVGGLAAAMNNLNREPHKDDPHDDRQDYR